MPYKNLPVKRDPGVMEWCRTATYSDLMFSKSLLESDLQAIKEELRKRAKPTDESPPFL